MRVSSLPRRGFTLLELLVVLAILATVGGGLLVAYDGLENQAAKGQATNTIAALDNSVRAFTVAQRRAPNNLDSLVAVDTPQNPAGATNFAAILTLSGNIQGKLTTARLTAAQAATLSAAGITQLRYIDAQGNLNTPGPHTLTIPAADGSSAAVGAISAVDIPARIFDVPRPGSGRNRGRGASGAVAANAPVMTWLPGAGGIDHLKIGAGVALSDSAVDPANTDVLVALGLGNNCSMLADDPSTVGDVKLSAAPYYVDVSPTTYNRYILLYNLGTPNSPLAKAKLQAVVDSRGDFLDEEFAEYTGQKQ